METIMMLLLGFGLTLGLLIFVAVMEFRQIYKHLENLYETSEENRALVENAFQRQFQTIRSLQLEFQSLKRDSEQTKPVLPRLSLFSDFRKSSPDKTLISGKRK